MTVTDDYFDAIILRQCSDKWRKLYGVVGDGMIAMWEDRHFIGDNFIKWRLRELESCGKVVSNRPITKYFKAEEPILVRLS